MNGQNDSQDETLRIILKIADFIAFFFQDDEKRELH